MFTLRKDLPVKGVVVDQGQHFVFARAILTSPSTAAGVILGRTANGRLGWRTKKGKTLKQLQDRMAEETDHE